MTNFFDRYKDLFEVDTKIGLPITKLTADNPLFAQQSYTAPLTDIKFNIKPINLTKEIDSFESKLENWRRDNQNKLDNFRVPSPLKLSSGSKLSRRPSSRKRSTAQISEENEIQKLSEIEDLLFHETPNNRKVSDNPIMRKISSYEVPNSNIRPEPIKLQPLKRKVSIRSQISSQNSIPQNASQKGNRRRWTIEELKLHRPTHSTNAQVIQKRDQAQRNLRGRQNRIRALLSNF